MNLLRLFLAVAFYGLVACVLALVLFVSHPFLAVAFCWFAASVFALLIFRILAHKNDR